MYMESYVNEKNHLFSSSFLLFLSVECVSVCVCVYFAFWLKSIHKNNPVHPVTFLTTSEL